MTERDWVDLHLVNAALDIHAEDPAFGYRFIADGLPEKGIVAGENRVLRLCMDHGTWSVFLRSDDSTRVEVIVAKWPLGISCGPVPARA